MDTLQLTLHADEKSTYPIRLSFRDSLGNPHTPASAVEWTLTDDSGNSINTGSEGANSDLDVVLRATDLATPELSGETVDRILTIETTYSSTIGADLPLTGSVLFKINRMEGI